MEHKGSLADTHLNNQIDGAYVGAEEGESA